MPADTNDREPTPTAVRADNFPRLEFGLTHDSRAPRVARRAVAEWLGDFVGDGRWLDDVSLVLSELVTNAVVHARPPLHVLAELGPGSLRLEVSDASAKPPTLRTDRPSVGGFGLRLVDDLTTAWGWDARPGGKVVWTHLANG